MTSIKYVAIHYNKGTLEIVITWDGWQTYNTTPTLKMQPASLDAIPHRETPLHTLTETAVRARIGQPPHPVGNAHPSGGRLFFHDSQYCLKRQNATLLSRSISLGVGRIK